MMNNKRDYIPSRWITYHFICRACGQSDVRVFDKFTNPKESRLLCEQCREEEEQYEELPFL